MPELPEVETLRRQMEKALVGRKILGIDVRFGGRIRPSPKALESAVGATFKAFGRRAKLLVAHLSNGLTIVTHLKMTGSYLLKKAGETPTKHVHVVFHLDKKEDLWFEDVRKFGFLKILKTADLEKEIFDKEGYGPEPLDPSFTFAKFKMCVTSRPAKKIKPLLMEQGCIAGIGNIYADEAVWYGKVHPERTVGSLSEKELKGVYEGALKSLRASVKRLGSSADNYRDLYGQEGGNVPHLWVYGRDGKPCRRCGTKLKKIWVAQRGSVYCPTCQRPPRSAK
ncbi:MAG TPA: bifunctional DNA-formamidopyrimidine glycosylase/DNA-(apurinic or apyrimidinic site) lyase [Candidatus Baltobacteraceae bacterium]|nr:bifunctional DNA-formamidopyrimidine glycosylase/DNA-(apurinic or apyrimidinic site) lyase [Candidatus Baltobacteraceae bacterium]